MIAPDSAKTRRGLGFSRQNTAYWHAETPKTPAFTHTMHHFSCLKPATTRTPVRPGTNHVAVFKKPRRDGILRVISLSVSLWALPAMAAPPVVSNVRASQVPGTKWVDCSFPP